METTCLFQIFIYGMNVSLPTERKVKVFDGHAFHSRRIATQTSLAQLGTIIYITKVYSA